jgi:hypothetical protein
MELEQIVVLIIAAYGAILSTIIYYQKWRDSIPKIVIDIEAEYTKSMSRKIGAWSYTLKPFIKLDSGYSTITMSENHIATMLLDILQYSLLTTNDALSQYATTLSNIVSKDRSFVKTMENDASILKSEIMKEKSK